MKLAIRFRKFRNRFREPSRIQPSNTAFFSRYHEVTFENVQERFGKLTGLKFGLIQEELAEDRKREGKRTIA